VPKPLPQFPQIGRDIPVRPGGYTIDEWCKHRRFSRSAYYRLREAGRAPKTYRNGNRPLISDEADREWLLQMESEGA
jgi:hypothetical protein